MKTLSRAFAIFFAITAATTGLLQARPPLDLPAVYRGQIPCADCSGINVTLTLNADGTYKLRNAYVGKGTSYVERGTWQFDTVNGMLTLQPASGGPEYYRGGNHAMRMLDANGDPIVPVSSHILERAGSTPASAALEGTTWYLVTLKGQGINVPAERSAPTMTLNDQTGHASGSGGCNSYSGGYTATASGSLTFSAIASTRMFCDGDMATENGFFHALSEVRGYHIDGTTLSLIDAGGATVATLRPTGP